MSKKEIPFIAVGNDELGGPIGSKVTCYVCGLEHDVEYGKSLNKETGKWEESKVLAFFKCGKKSYLCGIDGRKIPRRNNGNTYED